MSRLLFPNGQAEAGAWAARLPAGAFGRAGFHYLEATGSTQDEAFAAVKARGAGHGAVFVAESQAAGRGRHGNQWLAPAGRALLLSVVLKPAPAVKSAGRMALAAAALTARAIERAQSAARVEIKWPNDLLLGGRKVGGILLEARGGAAVLGLGLNVSQRPADFPPELRERSTSLAAELGTAPERRALLAELLVELGQALATSDLAGKDWEVLRVEVERRLAWRGREARVSNCPGGPLAGKIVGLDAQGRLLLDRSGRQTAVAAGSLDFLPA
jgi:BirA family biotin operon repressor/biotin-[acetyl-CoA-carboxylase] ligase